MKTKKNDPTLPGQMRWANIRSYAELDNSYNQYFKFVNGSEFSRQNYWAMHLQRPSGAFVDQMALGYIYGWLGPGRLDHDLILQVLEPGLFFYPGLDYMIDFAAYSRFLASNGVVTEGSYDISFLQGPSFLRGTEPTFGDFLRSIRLLANAYDQSSNIDWEQSPFSSTPGCTTIATSAISFVNAYCDVLAGIRAIFEEIQKDSPPTQLTQEALMSLFNVILKRQFTIDEMLRKNFTKDPCELLTGITLKLIAETKCLPIYTSRHLKYQSYTG